MQTVITEIEESRYAELQQLALEFARKGETQALAAMLDHGLPVNLTDAKGSSLLMLASYHGNVETTRMLLERGADADRRNDRGQTPLGGVAFKGYEEIVDLLLEHGADIDADNGGGMTPLMFAAMFGRTRVVEQLKAHGASLKQRNRLGISANWMVRCSRFVARILGKRQPERALQTYNHMNQPFPSLITHDAQAGLALAASLADQLQSYMDQAIAKAGRPGGMNYQLPAAVPKEITTSVLFYAVAAANQGWAAKD